MGVPTHDEVMRESSDGQGESELEGHSHLDLPERLPQNQNLSVLLSPTPLKVTGGYPRPLFSVRKST